MKRLRSAHLTTFLPAEWPAFLLGLALFSSDGRFSSSSAPPSSPVAFLSATDSLQCCYTLSYFYENAPLPPDQLETELRPAGATYSSVQYDLGSGWHYSLQPDGRTLRWTHADGTLPAGDQVLFDLCIDNGAPAVPAELIVRRRSGEVLLSADTLPLPCWRCLEPRAETVTCLDEGGYRYDFSLRNVTNYTIHRLELREPPGQDLVVENDLLLPAALEPGDTLHDLSLILRPEAEDRSELCFDLTARRLLADSSAVECCTFTRCLPLPVCDRCCTPFPEFSMDVNGGFTATADCEAGSITAVFNAWTPCDSVWWYWENLETGLGGGAFTGTGSVTFITEGLDETPFQLCMDVGRLDLGRDNCYGEVVLTYCDTILFDCPGPPCIDSTLIDWAFECPSTLPLVCGCDGMTYINACAAENWSGLTDWTEGPCGEPPVDSILLTVVFFDPSVAELAWATGGAVDYRYFLVQRRTPGGSWATIGQVPGDTFAFSDTDPLTGASEYRVVGVTFPGKPVFSNVEEIFITAAGERATDVPLHLWPNPAAGRAFLDAGAARLLRISTYNAAGELVFRTLLPGFETNSISLPSEEWPAGLYLIQVEDRDGRSRTLKFIRAP